MRDEEDNSISNVNTIKLETYKFSEEKSILHTDKNNLIDVWMKVSQSTRRTTLALA